MALLLRRQSAGLVLCAVLLTAGAGCGDGGSPTATSTPPSGANTASDAPEPPAPAQEHAPSEEQRYGAMTNAVVAGVCYIGGGRRVTLMAFPVTGGAAAQVDLAPPDELVPPEQCHFAERNAAARLGFSGDLNTMALEFNRSEEGATHVGYVDLVSGEPRNLDEQTGSSFSSAAPEHTSPVFVEGKAEMWFFAGELRDDEFGAPRVVAARPLSGGPLRETGFTADGSELVPSADGSGVFTKHSAGADPIAHPTLPLAASPGGGNSAELWLAAPGVNPFKKRALTVKIPSGVGSPFTWANENTLISVEGSGRFGSKRSLHVLEFSSDLRQLVRTRPLLPATRDRDNYSPAVSRDGRDVAFLSRRGSTTSLYVVSLSGGEPRLITDVPDGDYPNDDVVLLGWK